MDPATQTSKPVLEADLKDPDLYVDAVPHALFAELRREAPVHWNPESDGAGFWALTRYEDIVEVSRQPELFSSANRNGGHRIFNENEVGLTNAGDFGIGVPFISRDPPTHSVYRKAVMPALTPKRLEGIEARISERVAALVEALPLDETIDVVPGLCAPLPLLTLAELLAVPLDRWEKLYHWTNAFVGEDDPDFRQSPEAMGQTMSEFFAFARDLFDRRRAEPGPDIATLLANAQIDGQPIDFPEFVANLILTLVGGNETTRNSLSHTLASFAAHPEQWDLIRADPTLLNTAVREMVRYASPVMHMRRTAMADTTIAGQAIRNGDKVVMWYISGNRDETTFERPQDFDVTRTNVAHIGFGTGQHVCVGWRLAELQLKIAFGQLAPRVKRFEQIGQPRRFRSNFINGLKNLDLTMVAAG